MRLLASKTLAESKGDWDYFKLVSTIKAEDAWRPLEKGECPFVKV
jgi:branched-chain amino acid transport system substrate-binding protein